MIPAELEVALVARPAALKRRRLADLVLEIVVANPAAEPIEDALGQARLLVDGEDSVHFGLTVGNGIRAPDDYRVPAHGRRSFRLPGLGSGLFDGPGEHTLVLQIGPAESAPVRVTVRR